MSIKTPPEAIKREALMFGVMAGVIATTAMTLIGGINFLIAALVGVVLALVVWYIVVALGKESPPPRGEGNPDVSPQTSAPVAPAPERDMPEPVWCRRNFRLPLWPQALQLPKLRRLNQTRPSPIRRIRIRPSANSPRCLAPPATPAQTI